MNKIFLEIIRIFFGIVVIIFIIISIVLILIKLFGSSPSEITILFTVLSILVGLQVVIIGAIFRIMENMGKLKADVSGLKEFKQQTIDRIKKIEGKNR